MGYIILSGWEMNLEKVSLSKLQMEILKKSLSESKANVDSLLEGDTVIIEEDNEHIAQKFINEASKIGVICYYCPILISLN